MRYPCSTWFEIGRGKVCVRPLRCRSQVAITTNGTCKSFLELQHGGHIFAVQVKDALSEAEEAALVAAIDFSSPTSLPPEEGAAGDLV